MTRGVLGHHNQHSHHFNQAGQAGRQEETQRGREQQIKQQRGLRKQPDQTMLESERISVQCSEFRKEGPEKQCIYMSNLF